MKKLLLTIFALTFLLAAKPASAAVLYTGAANQVAYVGETFVVEWYLDTQGKSVNSLSLLLTYSKDNLEVVEATAADSAFDLWIRTPQVDAEKGTISMVGGLSGGVADEKLGVFRATFRPTQTGTAKLSMSRDSQLLLADGEGTQVGMIFNEVNFAINPAEAKPAQVSSSTNPDQDAWYKTGDVEIKVTPKEGEQYSYSFSSNLEVFPDDKPDDVSSPISFSDLPDNIYYFKLNFRTGAGEWQEGGVYRVKIDRTPPREFKPTIGQDSGVFDGKPFVSFSTTDSVSGISHYEVKSSFLSGWKRTDNPYFELSGLVLGDTIEVKVVDAAGNERIEQVKVDRSVVNSVFFNPFLWVIIVLSIIAAAWLIRKYFSLLNKYKIDGK